MSIILLEHPRPNNPERFEDVVNTPLSACLMTGYVASVLKSKKHKVEVFDANLYGWSFYQTVQELKNRKFNLLGIHLVYLWENTEDVFEVIKELRRNDVNAHINLYGHFPTFAFEEILSNYAFVDSVTIGEPEYTFLELAESLTDCNGKSDLGSIDGLALNSKINKGVEITKNKPRTPVSNLDEIPFPYRHNFEIYKGRGIATYILASRGCYGKCTFCYLNQFYGDQLLWRGRSPENIIDEICHIYEKYEEDYFYFADANFFGPGKKGKERACSLASMIMEQGLNINFGIECRVNDVTDESINMLVKAGLKDVFLGVESGSQNSLDRFKKLVTVDENKNAINVLRRYGIEPNYGFIIFEPDSALEDVRDNFEFLKEMKMFVSPSITAHLMHHRQTIFKGTPDYEQRKDTAKSVCKFDYEYVCDFKDERVGELAERVKAFCSKALEDMSKNRGPEEGPNSCSYDEDDSFSKDINMKLIDYFEETLCKLEAKPCYQS